MLFEKPCPQYRDRCCCLKTASWVWPAWTQASWERTVWVWEPVWRWCEAALEPGASPPHSCLLSPSAGNLLQGGGLGRHVRLSLQTWCRAPDLKPTCESLTSEAQVVLTSSSVAGRALGTRPAVLVRSLADPVAPERINSGYSD